MLTYVIRRLIYTIPILLGVNVVVFCLFFLVNKPEHMARQALGDKVTTEDLQRWVEARDYHLPLFFNTDYLPWVTPEADVDSAVAVTVTATTTDSETSTFTIAKTITETIFFKKSLSMFWGDFGLADMTQDPIGSEITSRIMPSLYLTIPIFFIALLCNIFFAMIIASFRGTFIDTFTQYICVFLMSTSALIYIIGGQYLFARVLKLVPISGFEYGLSMAKFLILPIIIGILTSVGGGIRLYRTFFLEEINKDYVRTARAKGLSEGRVLFVHVLKNALIPVLTNVPIQLLMLMMGNLLLENFFGIPGLGGYTIMAINAQDFAIVRSMVFFNSVLYIAGLLLADICYSIVDPRIRLG